MNLSRRRIIGGLIAVVVCVALLTVCDDRDSEQNTQGQREAQLQAQLQAEHAQKLEAQQDAHDARHLEIPGSRR